MGLATIEAEATDVYEVLPGPADARLILVCDHAGNAFPEGYGSLGLPPEQLERHIAYDIGAAAVTRGLAARLGVPAVLSRYSRLLIDPNRGLDDPTLIMRLSDGAIVPGNRSVDAAERARRIKLYYDPFDQALARTLDRIATEGPALFSIHSFTPTWQGRERPWEIGIAWDGDQRFAPHLIQALNAFGDWRVGDNEPYRGGYEGNTLWRHARKRGLASALVEMRQDLVSSPAGQHVFIDRLADVLQSWLAKSDVRASLQRAPEAEGSQSGTTSTSTELEAAAFRRLLAHLNSRTDVQNIDLMDLAGFCRNCLANWYAEAAATQGQTLSKDEARRIIYGMPYKDWAAKYQKEASAEAKSKFATVSPHPTTDHR